MSFHDAALLYEKDRVSDVLLGYCIDKAIRSSHVLDRSLAILHSNVTSTQIDKALNDVDWRVRIVAICHPNATSDYINVALKDQVSDVRHAAMRIKKNEIVKIICKRSPRVFFHVIILPS